MPRTVFYSWQSDLPNNTNRSLIERALREAIGSLNAELVEPEREVELDRDTEGVPGSPLIAETIFEKIQACSAFVCDVSIVGSSGEGDATRQHPNPNVLVEYGFAISAKGESATLLVFNEASGSISDLPFDVRHRRIIPFDAASGDSDADGGARSEARKILARKLEKALKSTLENEADEEPAATEASAVYGRSCFVTPSDLLGVFSEDWAAGDRPMELEIQGGPHLYLRLIPNRPQGELSATETLEFANAIAPFGPPVGGSSTGRNEFGAFVFGERANPSANGSRLVVSNLTQIFRTREIWGIDAASASSKRPDDRFYFAPSVIEDILVRWIPAFYRFAREKLAVQGALDIEIGLSRVGRSFAFLHQRAMSEILLNEVFERAEVEEAVDAGAALTRFLSKLYDAAGARYDPEPTS